MSDYIHNETFSNSGTRNEVRMRVVKKFSEEIPGTGSGINASRNTYFVETLDSGNRIFLRRPAWLKKGFDFVIHVENVDFGKGLERRVRTNPKHTELFEDLEQKKIENLKDYAELYDFLERVYNCEDVSKAEYKHLVFKSGYDLDLIVLIFKWFFIEQDIRDWSYSGRAMCFSGIPKK